MYSLRNVPVNPNGKIMNTFRYEINKKTDEFQKTSKDIRIIYVLDGQCMIERDSADRLPLEKADFIWRKTLWFYNEYTNVL